MHPNIPWRSLIYRPAPQHAERALNDCRKRRLQTQRQWGLLCIAVGALALPLLSGASAGALRNAGASARGSKAAAIGAKYAVIVGVNDYLDHAPKLRYAVSDAKRLYATLVDPKVGNVPEDHTMLLTSEQEDPTLKPTYANVVHAVEETAGRARPGDQFWFYFAGHGIEFHQLSYLLPQGFVLAKLDKTALSTHALRDLLDKDCKASQKVIILDACESGSARGLDTAPPLQQTLGGAGMITLSACSVNESAWEFPDFHDGSGGGGVFTYYLVNGLKKYADENHDGNVSATEIKDYVVGHVTEEVQKVRQVAQTPQFIALDANNLSHVYLSRTTDLNAAEPPPDTDMPNLEVKKPLPPALIVVLNGPGGAGNPVENAVIKRLLKKGFLIADTEAAKLLHDIVGDKPAAQAAGKRGARFLAIGQYTTSVNSPVPPFVTVVVSISARLVDEQGNALATAKGVSGPHAAGAEAAAESDAIEDAADKFVDDLAVSGVKKALGLDQNRP